VINGVRKVEVGDRVRVVATHVGTITAADDQAFALLTEDGKTIAGHWGPHLQVQGLRKPPEHWPPKPGEVWAAGDVAWVVGPDGDVRPTSGPMMERWTPLAPLDEVAEDFHRVWPQ
jgi:hypothetical protein